MTLIDQYTTAHSTREHRTIVFPRAERSAVLDAIAEVGYRIEHCGPYTDAEMFPAVDVTRGLIRMSREIEQ